MELRNYQNHISTQAADMLHLHKIVYLAMEVRTGKTITALEAARKYGAKTVLFVTKKKAIQSIKDDALHFPSLVVEVVNYESLHKVTTAFDLIVCDEAHGLGQYPKPSERTKELKIIATGKPIIFLSGTPTPEKFSQMFHQLFVSSFSPWKQYPNFYKWAKDYVIVKHNYIFNRAVNDYSNARKDLIEATLKPILLTYTQEQAGFNVAITEKILTVQMPKALSLINQLKKDLVINGKNGEIILADTAVKLMGKLHQLSGGTVLAESGQSFTVDDSKAQYIKAHFQGQKIAIFYKFKAEYDLLAKTFTNFTTDPQAFQASTDLVYLGQFVSSREGIRLDSADALVFYNIDFSFLSYEQAKNRIISKERTNEAVLYWVFCDGGLEARVLEAVKNKQTYTQSYFEKDYGSVLRKHHSA